MKFWTGMVVALCIGLLPGEARVQLENEGLTISGTVMVPGTREPVPGAGVSLREISVIPNEVTTLNADNSGRFGFTGLAPGRYTLQAFAAGAEEEVLFLSPANLTMVELSDNSLPPDVRLWLAPKSAISGRVTDADGNPLAGISVSLAVLGHRYGRPALSRPVDTLAALTGARTDGNGRYVMQVVSGEYYVFVGRSRSDLARTVVPRYYPGVLFPEDALPVTVPPGVDVPGIDIQVGETEPVADRNFKRPLLSTDGRPQGLITRFMSSFRRAPAAGAA